MKFSLVAALISVYVPFAGATVMDKLLTFSNDRTSITSDLDVTLDVKGVVQGMSYISNDGGVKTEKDFSLADLSSKNGAILEAQQGVNAVTLSGSINSQAGNGALVVHFIYNGLSGEYHTCNVNVQRNSSGVWEAINAYTNQPVTAAKIQTYSIGIQTIEGICP